MTSAEDRSAQNFGLDRLYEHDERDARAAEYTTTMLRDHLREF